MELKDFLLLLFDKQIDRYPLIRESFLQNWSPSEVINILAITNYRCTQKEFKRYIKYNCIDKGVTIVSLGSPYWSFSRDNLVNKTVYEDIFSNIEQSYTNWMTMIHSTRNPITAMFKASSENSLFYFSLESSANMYYINPPGGNMGGHIRLGYTIFCKYDARLTLSDNNTEAQNDVTSIPMGENQLSEFYKFLKHLIREICLHMSIDVSSFEHIFTREMKYRHEWIFDTDMLSEE